MGVSTVYYAKGLAGRIGGRPPGRLLLLLLLHLFLLPSKEWATYWKPDLQNINGDLAYNGCRTLPTFSIWVTLPVLWHGIWHRHLWIGSLEAWTFPTAMVSWSRCRLDAKGPTKFSELYWKSLVLEPERRMNIKHAHYDENNNEKKTNKTYTCGVFQTSRVGMVREPQKVFCLEVWLDSRRKGEF